MPRTRSGVASNQLPLEGTPAPKSLAKNTPQARKKRSADGSESNTPTAKKAKTEPQSKANGQETKPRLTTPDLEFDFDKNQLRDPRQTPGRVKRPRHEEGELSEAWKSQFYIPKPEKPAGRLNASQKEALFREAAFLDPSATFHDLYVCHRKGPAGSPTYDSAGFRLDWHKVNRWMKPQSYNKNAMVKGMERHLDQVEKDSRQMHQIFFERGKLPTGVDSFTYEHYMKDHVSKDLGIPIHQITPAHFQDWKRKGFTKPKADEWWREPNEVERAREMKMLSGGSLRMDLVAPKARLTQDSSLIHS
jgi:hypothetical protein